MSEYGPGVSMKQAFVYDRERIEPALHGELMCGETEEGFLYSKASKKECDQYILEAFDNAVSLADEMRRSANAACSAADKLYSKDGEPVTGTAEFFREYAKAMDKNEKAINCTTRQRT